MSFFDKIGLDKIGLDTLGERVGGFFDEVFLPEEVLQSLQNAMRAMERGEYQAALKILYRIHAQDSSIDRVHHLIGLCHFHLGELGKALTAFERGLTARADALGHLYAARCAEELASAKYAPDPAGGGDVALSAAQRSQYLHQAENHFRRGLEGGGKEDVNFDLLFGLGRIYLARGRADRAERELRKATRARPERPEATLSLARALIERAKLDEARVVLDSPAVRDFGAAAALLRAELEEASGDLRAAQAAYEATVIAIEQGPAAKEEARDILEIGAEVNIQLALIGAARTSMVLGDASRANRYLLQALTAGDAAEMAEIHLLLGDTNAAIQNDSRAMECYQTALDLKDASPQIQTRAHMGMGRILLRSDLDHADNVRRNQYARMHFQAALDHIPFDSPTAREAQQGLARAYLNDGDISSARRLIDAAIRQSDAPSQAMLFLLGQVALASGDAAEAVVAFQEASRSEQSANARQKQAIDAALQRALKRMTFDWQLPEAIEHSGALSEVLRQVREFVTADRRTLEFAPKVQQLIEDLDAPLSIALVGEFNAGKSTILNALIGEEVVPMGVLPTTAHLGIVQYGPRKSARIVQRDGRIQEANLAEVKAQMKQNAHEIAHLEFLYPHPALRSVEFWDTPGFNALDDAHEEAASRALGNADALLWVLDANQALSQSEFDQIDAIPDGKDRLLVLLNKIDRFGGPEARAASVEELLDYVEENAGERMAGCFPISGREAFALRVDTTDEERSANEKALENSGFPAFKAFLESQIIERSSYIKTLEVTRKLAALLEDIAASQHTLSQNYAALDTESTALENWLAELHQKHPEERAKSESRALEDRFDFVLTGLEREISEALRSQTNFLARAALTRKSLSDEDRDFILELLAERVEDILSRSRQQVLADVDAIEGRIAQEIGTIIAQLPLVDARAMKRRLEGFFDETRVLKLLLGERVFGQLSAQTAGRIDAAGRSALDEIRGGADGAPIWKRALRRLLPDARGHLTTELARWYEEFFLAAQRFSDSVQRDLHLLKLESDYRFDVSLPAQFLQKQLNS